VAALVRGGTLLALCASIACAGAPRPTAEMRRVDANPRATVDGRVTDAAGRGLAGVEVRGIPRAKDVPWLPWAVTRCDGTFRIELAAPSHYAFQLRWAKRSVITESPQDPARLEIPLLPGEHRTGVDLVLLSELWRQVTGPGWEPPAPRPEPACP
jgi:hypothetical protein